MVRVKSALPDLPRVGWRWIYGHWCSGREWLPLRLWVIFQCVRRRRRAVILCRFGAMGDLICALPMAAAVRERHPGRALLIVTAAQYRNLVRLSDAGDGVFGSRLWTWPFVFPKAFNVAGLVDAVYVPQTTDERDKRLGATCHLVDDLAASCGLGLRERQPRLRPSESFIAAILHKHGLDVAAVGDRRRIVINGGPTWPVRMWSARKWQELVDGIHGRHEAVVIQLGAPWAGGASGLESLRGVHSLFGQMSAEEIVALIAGSDLVVAIDSGPVHIAGAVGTPVVGMFGPVSPAFRMPPDSPGEGLFSDVPCRFCHHQSPPAHWITGCPQDVRCMDELEVATVLAAVDRWLGAGK